MGYYLNSTGSRPLVAHGKAEFLIEDCGAVRVPQPATLFQIGTDKALICVINNNGLFEAAALIYDENELRAFGDDDDHRLKVWLTMDRKLAHELARYKEGAVGS